MGSKNHESRQLGVPLWGESHIIETGESRNIRAQRDLKDGLCLKFSNLLLQSAGCCRAAGRGGRGVSLSPCSYFNLNTVTFMLFVLDFCIRFCCCCRKCAKLCSILIHPVHQRKKGSPRVSRTLPEHTASLGQTRDFSLAPFPSVQKGTNGMSSFREEFVSPQGISQVPASGLVGPSWLSLHWMP